MATTADIVGYPLKEDEGVDSFSLFPVLKGEKKQVREDVIHHLLKGYFALRDARWK